MTSQSAHFPRAYRQQLIIAIITSYIWSIKFKYLLGKYVVYLRTQIHMLVYPGYMRVKNQ